MLRYNLKCTITNFDNPASFVTGDTNATPYDNEKDAQADQLKMTQMLADGKIAQIGLFVQGAHYQQKVLVKKDLLDRSLITLWIASQLS